MPFCGMPSYSAATSSAGVDPGWDAGGTGRLVVGAVAGHDDGAHHHDGGEHGDEGELAAPGHGRR